VGPGPCPFNSAVVSPDGRQIAWISTDDPEGSGTLMVSDLSGANRRTLRSDFGCLGSTSLIWVDPTQISVGDDLRRDPNYRVLFDSTTGEAMGDEDQGVWSDADAWVATTDRDGNPLVKQKGSLPSLHTYTYAPPADEAAHHDGWNARSVSIDGRYVSVGWNNTDQSRNVGSFAVVDTLTSTVVILPVTGAVSSVHFLADGTVLVRTATGQLVLLDRQFEILDRATEPASVHDLPLLRYVPPQH
jgi:hypothetical protein